MNIESKLIKIVIFSLYSLFILITIAFPTGGGDFLVANNQVVHSEFDSSVCACADQTSGDYSCKDNRYKPKADGKTLRRELGSFGKTDKKVKWAQHLCTICKTRRCGRGESQPGQGRKSWLKTKGVRVKFKNVNNLF